MSELTEYKRSIQERLDNGDLLVTRAINETHKLSMELENKNQELEQLRGELEEWKSKYGKLKSESSQYKEDIEVVKDFFAHMVQVRIQTGSPYEDDQGLWFNISQGNDTVSIDYKLGFVKGNAKGDDDNNNKDSNNSTEIIYVPLLKALTLAELKLLQEKLPSYMFETLSFPLDALNQFYTKMSKCLNK